MRVEVPGAFPVSQQPQTSTLDLTDAWRGNERKTSQRRLLVSETRSDSNLALAMSGLRRPRIGNPTSTISEWWIQN